MQSFTVYTHRKYNEVLLELGPGVGLPFWASAPVASSGPSSLLPAMPCSPFVSQHLHFSWILYPEPLPWKSFLSLAPVPMYEPGCCSQFVWLSSKRHVVTRGLPPLKASWILPDVDAAASFLSASHLPPLHLYLNGPVS